MPERPVVITFDDGYKNFYRSGPGTQGERDVRHAFYYHRLLDVRNGSLECRRQDGSPAGVVQPGETVSVAVTFSNRGAPSDVLITLELYFSDHREDIPYYRQTVEKHLTAQDQKLVWEIIVPDGIQPGRHYYRLNVQDEHAVLGFMDSGRQPFFFQDVK